MAKKGKKRGSGGTKRSEAGTERGSGGTKRSEADKGPHAPAKRSSGKTLLIVGTLAVVGTVIALAVANGGSGGRTGGQATSEELKYLGRFLPEGYEEPKVAEPTIYTSSVGMSPVTATQDEQQLSIPAADVVANKIVVFEYEKDSGEALPMLAYVKPSGKLLVGVSYCPPCQGEGQTITADGTLTCDSCGTKRNLESQTGISGPCKLYPLDELPSTVAGDRIVVEKSVIEAWSPQPLDRKIG
ncbi:MAG: DUF2318 domain-containing protein [Coriobacteriia bacterium]|nr:DUF2318 domain-containing protein [Coriobacteriia bacterium]